MRAAIHGVGTSLFAKQPRVAPATSPGTAVTQALDDAGTAAPSIEAAYVGTCFGEPGIAQRALHKLGLAGIPIYTVENACASGTTAFHLAREAIDAGRHERVLALGVETMSTDVPRRDRARADRRRGRQRHARCRACTPWRPAATWPTAG